jgi:hypothetical protein
METELKCYECAPPLLLPLSKLVLRGRCFFQFHWLKCQLGIMSRGLREGEEKLDFFRWNLALWWACPTNFFLHALARSYFSRIVRAREGKTWFLQMAFRWQACQTLFYLEDFWVESCHSCVTWNGDFNLSLNLVCIGPSIWNWTFNWT